MKTLADYMKEYKHIALEPSEIGGGYVLPDTQAKELDWCLENDIKRIVYHSFGLTEYYNSKGEIIEREA